LFLLRFFYIDKARQVKNNAMEIIAHLLQKINMIIFLKTVKKINCGAMHMKGFGQRS